jgi:hypothetical protein
MAEDDLGLLIVYHMGTDGEPVVSVSLVARKDVEDRVDDELQTFALRIGMDGVITDGLLGLVVYASANTFGAEHHFWSAWFPGLGPFSFPCNGFSEDSYRDFSDDYLELTGHAFY